VAEVEQRKALEHPRQRGHPPGMWVEAIAHRSFLPTGRGGTGSAMAFSDEVRASVAGGGPASGWREGELGSTFHGRKSGKRGLGLRSPWKSSRRRLDSDGGADGQRRSAPNTDDGAARTTGGGGVGRAVGTPAHGSNSALKARELRWCVAATLRWHADGRPGAESGS
jgi:hypothetical protein